MKEKYIIMDVAKCHDCNNCFLACLDEYAENDWSPYQAPAPRHGHRWMDVLRRERGENDRIDTAFLAKPCFQCGDAACLKAGAAGDFGRMREDGIVVFDLSAGKGKDITGTCPYGAIWWNPEEQLSQKCDFCAHLLDDPSWEPGVPRCVHTCPTGALAFVSEEPAEFEKRVSAEGLCAYKPELCAKPHVWYKNLHRFTKNFIAGQVLKGGDVAPGVVVTLRGAGDEDGSVESGIGGDSREDGSVESGIGGAGCEAELTSDIFGEFRFDGLDDGEYTLFAEGKELAKVTVAGASLDAGDFEI